MSDHRGDASVGRAGIPFQSSADEARAREGGGTGNTTAHGLSPEGVPLEGVVRQDVVDAEEANALARLVAASFPLWALERAPLPRGSPGSATDRGECLGFALLFRGGRTQERRGGE